MAATTWIVLLLDLINKSTIGIIRVHFFIVILCLLMLIVIALNFFICMSYEWRWRLWVLCISGAFQVKVLSIGVRRELAERFHIRICICSVILSYLNLCLIILSNLIHIFMTSFLVLLGRRKVMSKTSTHLLLLIMLLGWLPTFHYV